MNATTRTSTAPHEHVIQTPVALGAAGEIAAPNHPRCGSRSASAPLELDP